MLPLTRWDVSSEFEVFANIWIHLYPFPSIWIHLHISAPLLLSIFMVSHDWIIYNAWWWKYLLLDWKCGFSGQRNINWLANRNMDLAGNWNGIWDTSWPAAVSKQMQIKVHWSRAVFTIPAVLFEFSNSFSHPAELHSLQIKMWFFCQIRCFDQIEIT